MTVSSLMFGPPGNQADTSAFGAGAVYVYTRAGTTWSQQAYVKASNTRADADFGSAVALSADGSRLAVGSATESSAATGINGDQADTSATRAGAVYVFTRTSTTWTQQAYIKASNTSARALFGTVALSNDGNTLAVGSPYESSNATGNDGNQADASATNAGALYMFTRRRCQRSAAKPGASSAKVFREGFPPTKTGFWARRKRVSTWGRRPNSASAAFVGRTSRVQARSHARRSRHEARGQRTHDPAESAAVARVAHEARR